MKRDFGCLTCGFAVLTDVATSVMYRQMKYGRVMVTEANNGGRAAYGEGLRSLDFWDCGFESH